MATSQEQLLVLMPPEVLETILSHLSGKEIVALGQLDAKIAAATRSRALWVDKLGQSPSLELIDEVFSLWSSARLPIEPALKCFMYDMLMTAYNDSTRRDEVTNIHLKKVDGQELVIGPEALEDMGRFSGIFGKNWDTRIYKILQPEAAQEMEAYQVRTVADSLSGKIEGIKLQEVTLVAELEKL